MTINNLLNLAMEYSEKRCNIINDGKGKAYMSCLILGKNSQCVLCKRYKLLQYR